MTTVNVTALKQTVTITAGGSSTVVTVPETVVVTAVTQGPQGTAGTGFMFRSITIVGPQVNDAFTLFRTTSTTAITSAIAVVSNGSVTYELRYSNNRSDAGTLATALDTVTNTTTGDSATIQNQPIPVNYYVWVVITAISGAVNEFNLSVAF